MNTSPRVTHSRLRAVAALAAAVLSTHWTTTTHAATKTWLDTDGLFWSNTAGWTPAIVPVNGDDVIIGTHSTSTSSPTLLFTSTLTGVGLNSLTINSNGSGLTGTMLLSQSLAGSAMIATTETIGDTISGNLYTQNAGSNTVATLVLANQTGSSGAYTLSGSGVLNAANVQVGSGGTGTMTQSGGTFNLTGLLTLGGSNTTSFSTYALSGGTIAVASTATLQVGTNVAHASFTQNGGNITYAASNFFVIDNPSTGNNTFSLTAGNITGVGFLRIANAPFGIGSAAFVQSGGAFTTSSNGTVAVGDIGNGSYTLSAGTLTTYDEVIGNSIFGNGVFAQSGGTQNITNNLNMGVSNGSVAVLNLTGGVTNLQFANGTGAGAANIGGGGAATVNQSGGTFNAPLASMNLGYANATSTATDNYNLSGTGQLSVGSLTVGFSTIALNTFAQSGGNATFNQVNVGTLAGGRGQYILSGGSFLTSTMVLNSNATFSQGGGSSTISSGLYLGSSGSNAAYYVLDNTSGISTLAVGLENIGAGGNGTFVQYNGTHTAGFIQIATGNFSTGDYDLHNGTLTIGSVASPGALNVGLGGAATFVQFAGTTSIPGTGYVLLPGGAFGSAGFEVDGGSFTAGSFRMGGYAGTYNAYLEAGNMTLTDPAVGLTLATVLNANVTFTLDNQFGPSSLITVTETLGTLGTATFNQANGTHSVTGTFTLGNGGTATFNLMNGTLSIATALLGNAGRATFNQTGGIANFLTTATLTAPNAASPGVVYTLSGGTLNAPATANHFIINPNASLTETTADGTPIITGYINNNGAFNYAGGTFNGTLENDLLGFINILATNSPITLIVNGGLLNKGTITLNPNQILGAGSPSTLDNEDNLVLAGGSLAGTGTILNNSVIFGFGTIAGSGGLTNNGAVLQTTGNFLLANTGPNINNNLIALAAGRQLQLSPGSLTNAASLTLSNSLIVGTGTLTNAPAGTLSGSGIISTPFLNTGTVAPAGTLTISTPWTNAGVVQLTGSLPALLGAAIINTGTINGAGTLAAPINNTTGTIEAMAGTLAFTNTLTNGINGTLRVTSASKILVQGPSNFPTNAGLIDLAGGTFDNGGQPLNNTGTIAGYGVFSSGGLTNNANITFTGGTATINGPVTNTANHTLNVKYQPALFTGNVTNNANATIKTTSTTATFTGTFINNGSYLSDPSTNIFAASTNNGLMSGSTGDVFTFSSTFTNTGTFTNGGNLNVTGSITNSGTFTQTGPQSWSSTSGFTNTAGLATFSSNAKLANLAITGGTVDTTLSQLVIESTAKSTTLAALQADAANDSLTSSTVPSNLALALIDNAALTHPFTTFGGMNVDANSILIAPELLGDANIDGHVDLNDLNTVLNNLGSAQSSWTAGNFDHATTIDLNDLNAVLNHLGTSYANSSTALATESLTPAPAATPEPASLSLLVAGGLLLARRPRTRAFIGPRNP